MEVKISDWELLLELNERIEEGSIFKTKNGKLWPRYCPRCGCNSLREYGVTVNIPQDVLSKMSYDEWYKFQRELLDKEDRHLPDLPMKKSGTFYFVRCENVLREYGCSACWNHNWFSDLDGARWDFFNSNE
jgi:hypothetical protein